MKADQGNLGEGGRYKINISVFSDNIDSELDLPEVNAYIPIVGLLGYTGVGKSSLGNALI